MQGSGENHTRPLFRLLFIGKHSYLFYQALRHASHYTIFVVHGSDWIQYETSGTG